MANCNICLKRVLSHAYKLQCTSCKQFCHLKCLPMVSKKDSVYTNRTKNNWFCLECTQSSLPFNHFTDDDDFIEALSSDWRTESIIPLDFVNNLDKMFLPFDLNTNENLPLHDADPDIQYYQMVCNSTLNSCDYHLEDSFNNMISRLDITNECLSLLHMNIRSMPKNMNKFENYLELLNHKFSIIGITETWLKESTKQLYSLDGYQPIHICRPDRSGGGVSLLIKDHLEYTVRTDLCVSEASVESLFIEIDKNVVGKNKNVIVGVIYRPPDTDMKKFNECIEPLLTKIKLEDKISYLLGDYNINLLNAECHPPTQEFADLMMAHCMIPTIIKPTRVTTRSATLIDNIFCESILDNNKQFNGIMYTDISDHFPIFHIDYSSQVISETQFIRKRVYSDRNKTMFDNLIRNHNWSDVLASTDPQAAYTLYHKEFSDIYQKAFPIKNIKIGYKTRKPWLSDSLKKSIKKKNKWYFKIRKSTDIDERTKYNQYRNSLNGILVREEREHYEKLFKDNQNNLRHSWKILKNVINKRKSTSSTSRFIVNNNLTTDKKLIAEGFNSFFTNIGPDLAKKIPNDPAFPSEFLKKRNIESMFVQPVVEKEVQEIIKALKLSSSGWDSISANVVKSTYSSFLIPLTHVMNLSITKGIFPSELKIARVIPLFKSGDSSSFSNYRPVSVLPLFSKILERLMYKRLLKFINSNKLLYDYQFGFRGEHSPQLALIYLLDKVSDALENGEYVLGLFLDFSKAFDTVNHSILFTKLEHYGVRDICLNWFKSYLDNRIFLLNMMVHPYLSAL